MALVEVEVKPSPTITPHKLEPTTYPISTPKTSKVPPEATPTQLPIATSTPVPSTPTQVPPIPTVGPLDVLLLDAIHQENAGAVKQYIQVGADVNATFISDGLPFAGASALHLATLKRSEEIVRLLLNGGADIDIRAKDDFGGTPLHWAVFWAFDDMTELLVDAGADVNSQDNFSLTPLDTVGAENPFSDQEGKIFAQNRSAIKEFLRVKGGLSAVSKTPSTSSPTQVPTATVPPVRPAAPSPTQLPTATVTPVKFAPTPEPFGFVRSRADELYTPALAVPDFSKIELTWLGDGFTQVIGSKGAVPADYPVYVVSPNTAHAALTTADMDGSFSVQLVAPPGSWVIVKYDPTNGDWLHSEILKDTRPARVNAAIGAMAQVPFEPPSGNGVPFVISGSTYPSHLDFTLRGLMTGTFESGGSVILSGEATVYPAGESTSRLTGQRLGLDTQLHPLFDHAGRPRIMANSFFSTILTPTKLPIQHWGGFPLTGGLLETDTLQPDGGSDVLTAPFTFQLGIPEGIADGIYTIWLDTAGSSIEFGSLGGPRPSVNPFMTNHALAFPPFTIGASVSPRLIWTLLTDVPSADGSRGTVSAGDAADFQIANRIATQAHQYIIPRLSKATGRQITYRLEPYLPMVAHGDRYIPNVPNIAFKFPSGVLSVQVTRPDGIVDTLGPAPFTTAASRTPATSGGLMLDDGGGHLAEVFQLSTSSGAFDYQFPSYGEYTIEMNGDVEDIYGNVYQGGGTYTVFVAEPLDIEPATLPMTPFEVGDVLNPSVSLLPGVPAKVEVKATLFVESEPSRMIEQLVTGTANRFGVFAPPLGSKNIEMTGPGELLVETTVSYVDSDGVLWMGATRWGQVVAPTDTPLLAHGRRGRDNTSTSPTWFFSPHISGDPSHVNLPFATGDVLWQTDDDAAMVIITAQDTEGLVTSAILAWDGAGKYHSRGEHAQPPPTIERRARIGELPLAFATKSGMNPALVPEDIVSYGYWYGGIQRPGERVREIISDDGGAGTGYWRFGEMYALQPGMGRQGDLPNDFKFQFGGAVFRDTTRDLNRYGIYGSLWVQLADDDPTGSRVFPPFQGVNGGPNGGPLLTLGEDEIDAFVVPLAVRPGTILESGDTFSFSAQLAPTLPGMVDVTISGPNGITNAFSGRANAIGYYYDPAEDFIVDTPGLYHVSVTATFDSPTSAGPMSTPFPTGTVLGAVEGGFDIYVVPRGNLYVKTPHPQWSVLQETNPNVQDVTLLVGSPGERQGTVHYTIGMPGHLLDSGIVNLTDGWARVVYDPLGLRNLFTNIDISGRINNLRDKAFRLQRAV
ncbi:MAG: ankyrin repeat domain-containing protein [SAR202 cluster bacterium]|nr:ankyrin repeat domain-containing protein [SAR202 cluster bacterium]